MRKAGGLSVLKEAIVCAFCKTRTKPRRSEEGDIVAYRCTKCNGVIAAYSRQFEEVLRLGALFRKYPVDQYKPKPPNYIKTLED